MVLLKEMALFPKMKDIYVYFEAVWVGGGGRGNGRFVERGK